MKIVLKEEEDEELIRMVQELESKKRWRGRKRWRRIKRRRYMRRRSGIRRG